jgi:hypothetical protein
MTYEGNGKTVVDGEIPHANLCSFRALILAVFNQVIYIQNPFCVLPGHSAPTFTTIPCHSSLLTVMYFCRHTSVQSSGPQ